MLEKSHLPPKGCHIVPDDVDGVVISDNLKIPVVRREPAIQDGLNFDPPVPQPKPPGRFFPSVPGIAFNGDCHAVRMT